MHCIHSSVICPPLLLNRDSVKLPPAVPHSIELLHMLPISDRDGRAGRSGLRCRLLSTFGCTSGKNVSQLRSPVQYDTDAVFRELVGYAPPPGGRMDRGDGQGGGGVADQIPNNTGNPPRVPQKPESPTF